MYCDLWPYVPWPLDFHFQKRILSAETIRGNTVCLLVKELKFTGKNSNFHNFQIKKRIVSGKTIGENNVSMFLIRTKTNFWNWTSWMHTHNYLYFKLDLIQLWALILKTRLNMKSKIQKGKFCFNLRKRKHFKFCPICQKKVFSLFSHSTSHLTWKVEGQWFRTIF